MWPLLGYSCSNRWPDIQHILVALTRFSELKRKKKTHEVGREIWKRSGRSQDLRVDMTKIYMYEILSK